MLPSIRSLRCGSRFLPTAALAVWVSICLPVAAHAGPPSGTHGETLMHDGVQRHYLVHVPAALGEKPVPLVLMLHGRGGNGREIEQLTGWSDKADKEKFIVVYPNALGSPPAWNSGLNPQITGDDVGFLKQLIAKMENEHPINAKRIYCCGFSSGAGMSYRMASECSDKIAAVGVSSGTIGSVITENGMDTVHVIPAPAHPVAVIHFHGKQDMLCPYNGGPNPNIPNGKVFAVHRTIKFWVDHDSCSTPPNETMLQNGHIVRDAYQGGQNGTSVVLYTFMNGGHQWPKVQTEGVSATNLIWEFLEAHPKQ